MADIFISYARADRDKIEKLASALEAEGYSVWWDKRIQPGAEFSKDIEAELAAATAVLVCWSRHANDSRWVKDEANAGASTGKLMTLTLDGKMPPLGFRQFHCADLSHWHGKADERVFVEFDAAVKMRVTGAVTPVAETRGDGLERYPARVLMIAGLAMLVAVSAGYFLMRSGADAPASASSERPVAASEKSIAVLPFVALSDDSSDEYFGKGVSEELLNALAKFPELKVAARTSAFSFEEKDANIREIGGQLGVAHVLEGSVRRSGDQLRITAQLIRAEDGFHLWSNTYEKSAADIFEIEDEIVRDISRTLEVRLGVGAGGGRASGEGVDPRAYDEYLRGLTLWGDRDRAARNRPEALKAFQNAAGFDPDFADAWAGIGVVGAYSFPFHFGVTREELSALTDSAFQNALALDAQNPIANAGLAMWRLGKPDIYAAQMHLERALALSPNRADSHYVAAHYWMVTGEPDRAAEAFERALALDPLNMMMRRSYASFLAGTGRFDEAFAFLDACQATRCLAEGFPAHAMFQAIYSGDAARIAKWLPVYEELEQSAGALPAAVKPTPLYVMPAAVSIAAKRSGAASHIHEARVYLEGNVVREEIGMWGPILAQVLPADIILDSIESAAEHNGFVGSTQNIAPLYGINPWPEKILKHPRYHAVWARRGMAELAAARRAKGWVHGLPLPIGGAAD